MSGPDLPQAVDQAAYRIVQEALTNALKHGGAHTARVDLVRSADELEIRVSNPLGGAAATPARTEQPGRGLGVTGIASARPYSVGGRMPARRATENGGWMCIYRSVPVSAREHR